MYFGCFFVLVCTMTKARGVENIPFVCTFESENDLESWSCFNRDDDEACWSFGKAD